MTETLTDTQEKRLRENGYFLYQGCHFKPVRQFTEKDGDFFEKTRRLRRDDELGMMEADIFFCLETMKEYTPCTHELQEYVMEQEKLHDREKVR